MKKALPDWIKQPRIIVLFSIVFIAIAGYGMILPVLPYYAESMGASATDLGFLFAVYPLMQFFFSPVWGRLSDKIGRRPVILFGMSGFALSFALFGFATNLTMLFAARILGGILSSATLPTSYAYIADVSSIQDRARGISWVSASTGLGIFIGPVIGGFLGEVSPGMPFFGAGTMSLAIMLAGFFFLPESLPSEHRQATLFTPWLVVRDMLTSSLQFLRSPFGFMLVVIFFMNFASANLESTLGLMVKASLGFGSKEVGLLFTIAGIVMVITQSILVGPLIDRFGEAALVSIGLLASGVGYTLLPYGRSLSDLVLIFALMSVFSSPMRPAATAWLSKNASEGEQGVVLGQSNSYMSFGRVIGPVTGGFLFNEIGYSAPYIFAALIFGLTLIITGVVFHRQSRYRRARA